jgi:hypothetical protein
VKDNKDYGVVSFPFVNDDYSVIDDGMTNVYLVVYDNKGLENISEYQTHLFLDGIFVADDCAKRPTLDKDMKDIDIDELINDQLANDNYNDYYFPNFSSDDFTHDEMAKYLSIPLIASIRIGNCDMTFENNNTPQYWNCTYDDLNDKGKVVYKIFEEMYKGKEIRILTFVNNIM